MKLTKDQAEDNYLRAVARLANGLRALADDVERLGKSRAIGSVPAGADPYNRVWAASDVHNKVLGWLGQHNGALMELWWMAIEAEHATARSTPAELLDAATTGLQDVGPADPHTEDEHVLLAEAALRGAGVIR